MNRNPRDKKDQYASYMTFDEYGRPFIILREQSEKEQISGVDVIKVSITSLLKSYLLQQYSSNFHYENLKTFRVIY